MTSERLASLERWILRTGAFLLPLAYSLNTYDQYVLPKLLVARMLLLTLLLLFLARIALIGMPVIKRTPLDLPLLLFLGSALLSTLLAYNQDAAVFGTYTRYDGLLTMLTYAGLFWLAVQSVADEKHARALLRVLLASGYLVAVIALGQWMADSFHQTGTPHAYGTMGQWNVLGAFLALLWPLAARELVDARTRAARIVAGNVMATLSLALLLSFSRSSWLAALLAAMVWLAADRRRSVLAALTLPTIPALVVAGAVIGAASLGQSSAGAAAVLDTSDWHHRLEIWRATVPLIESRPLAGYGPDNFGFIFPRFQTVGYAQPVDKAHAELLQIAATQGLLGVAAYLFLIGRFVWAFWRGHRAVGALPIFAGWLAYEGAIQVNFSVPTAAFPFWIFAAAAVVSWGAVREAAIPQLPPTMRVGAASTVAGAVLVLGLVGIAFPYTADVWLRSAVNADIAGDGTAAGRSASRAADLSPWEGVYAVEVGNVAFERSDWATARAAYERAVELDTYSAFVFRNLALADQNLGLSFEARAAARRAYELDRFDPANQALLAQLGS